MQRPAYLLPVIVGAQFCCTSLWFAGNGVMADLVAVFGLADSALGHLTSAVQFGFITGTFLFALFTVADRFSPSRVFFVCALLGATCNAGVSWAGHGFGSLLALRFLTGFFLAGIYPVGMKIASDYYATGLGRSLGYLVGALVVGTAFPHLLKGLTAEGLPWRWVLYTTSGLALAGGTLLVLLVPDGPHRRPGVGLQPAAFLRVFREPKFRAAAFGYFGHMWELYAFWAFVPVMLQTYASLHPGVSIDVPVVSFLVIGAGGVACVAGGYLAEHWGARRTASTALLLSGVCCVLAPVAFSLNWPAGFIAFLLFWGMVVVADSPLFSTLVAANAPAESRGTALTIVNCIGFAITIVSIQLVTGLRGLTDSPLIYAWLAPGPALGLLALCRRQA
ncbi:MFS family permease [Lewinella marina]|uniref:MFS transporter n=1 Tax=Neolewinella marina TaxID=438751 RepID=A0A2G0CAW6_9BACT|nr:MFS transporter [Neolewinella marina]NJB87185.1 MFS family permease [Neolewinella marina]PHK97067.1 MFS transporter [Neolewinella marina]